MNHYNPYEAPKQDSRRCKIYILLDNLDKTMICMAVITVIGVLWMTTRMVLSMFFGV